MSVYTTKGKVRFFVDINSFLTTHMRIARHILQNGEAKSRCQSHRSQSGKEKYILMDRQRDTAATRNYERFQGKTGIRRRRLEYNPYKI